MTFYYRPTVTEAFSSVQYIMTEANFLWLVNPISSSMVSKYDGSNDDPARISCVSHRWILKTPRINLGHRCGFGCIDCILWCNWLFFTLVSIWLLGSQNCDRCT
uniref:Cytochrome b/b6 N-terminal region profile domain-containing protein n=1 Tax=Stipa capillata TaxID=665498 RepID=A0A8F5V7G5_9POAL|nr:hypothetical protein [Stipa capillata]